MGLSSQVKQGKGGALVVGKYDPTEPRLVWKYDPAAQALVSRQSGLVADVCGAATAPGAELLTWKATGAPNQRFYFDLPSGGGSSSGGGDDDDDGEARAGGDGSEDSDELGSDSDSEGGDCGVVRLVASFNGLAVGAAAMEGAAVVTVDDSDAAEGVALGGGELVRWHSEPLVDPGPAGLSSRKASVRGL